MAGDSGLHTRHPGNPMAKVEAERAEAQALLASSDGARDLLKRRVSEFILQAGLAASQEAASPDEPSLILIDLAERTDTAIDNRPNSVTLIDVMLRLETNGDAANVAIAALRRATTSKRPGEIVSKFVETYCGLRAASLITPAALKTSQRGANKFSPGSSGGQRHTWHQKR